VEAAGCPWSVRLKALLPAWLPWARRRLRLSVEREAVVSWLLTHGFVERRARATSHRQFVREGRPPPWLAAPALRPGLPIPPHGERAGRLPAAVCRELQTISARQIDRRLAETKQHRRPRRYGRTKPGTLLKHHIALRTDHWAVREPGFVELDLVAHAGSRADGEFGHSLNVTDIHTTWVETRAVQGRGEVRVQEAVEEIRQALPFRLRGIDSDNGSEFINDHLYRYCPPRPARLRCLRARDGAPRC
jgi:hypothetical protein